MVVVLGKDVREFNLVFPANIQAVDYAKTLKQLDCPVNGRPVNFVFSAAGQYLHALRFLVQQKVENDFAWFGQTGAVLLKDGFQILVMH